MRPLRLYNVRYQGELIFTVTATSNNDARVQVLKQLSCRLAKKENIL